MKTFKVKKLTTGEVISNSKWNYLYLGMDGKVYEVGDDGGCSDQECCGGSSPMMIDVSKHYEIIWD